MQVGYIYEFQGRQFTPNGPADVSDAGAHNAALEHAELAEWHQGPSRFYGYVDADRKVTTWLGTVIGYVSESHVYRNNLTGSETRHIRVIGTNGRVYSGRYGWEWSQLVRLHRVKDRRF